MTRSLLFILIVAFAARLHADDKRTLYPPIEPYQSGYLSVDGGHQIYWEESGNPNGKPVVFLHGGPGAGTTPSNRSFFNPELYRIVLFDQRGSGKSLPFSKLENNTTWDLVSDIEGLRKHLTADKKADSMARIECHYFIHNSFLETDNWILENIQAIRHIPCILVQGRYDMACPTKSAWELHRAWPEAELRIIPDAGHSATEPGILDALIRATDLFSEL